MLNLATTVLRGARRGVMSPKRGNKHYYKGKRANPTGFHTRKGGFVMDPAKQVHIVAPDLAGFQLKPYVSQKTPLGTRRLPTAGDFLAK